MKPKLSKTQIQLLYRLSEQSVVVRHYRRYRGSERYFLSGPYLASGERITIREMTVMALIRKGLVAKQIDCASNYEFSIIDAGREYLKRLDNENMALNVQGKASG